MLQARAGKRGLDDSLNERISCCRGSFLEEETDQLNRVLRNGKIHLILPIGMLKLSDNLVVTFSPTRESGLFGVVGSHGLSLDLETTTTRHVLLL